MLLLTSTNDKVRIVTSSAGLIDVHASWVDNASGVITPGRTNTAIVAATTTDVVASPGASIQRNVQTLIVRNKHASSSQTVTVQHTDGATSVELFRITLGPGEELQYIDGEGFRVIDSSGQALSGPTSSPAGVVPIGGIIMWSGAIASIPNGWALCNGTSNSPGPDLRDKFIVGATQDDGGVAKTNIEGILKVTGGVTGVSHSAHGNLSHTGGLVGDHTGLTHGLTISNHPDLTHPALSHPAQTITHPDHSVASQSHSHAEMTLTHAHHSLASFTGSHASLANASVPSGSVTIPSGTHSHAAITITGTGSVTNTVTRSVITTGGLVLNQLSPSNSAGLTATANIPSSSGTHASQTGSIASVNNASVPSGTHSHDALTITHANHSVPSFSGSHAEMTLTHAHHSLASLSHQNIGTHAATDYGVHAFTAPTAHGAAGTLTHSFTQPDQHTISGHDTVLSLPVYYALAFIQRMA